MNQAERFMKRNRGKYVVEQAKIVVRRAFDSQEQAEEWANYNYRDRANWRAFIIPLRPSTSQ